MDWFSDGRTDVQLPASATSHVQAYLDYRRIVGEDDWRTVDAPPSPMTPRRFESFRTAISEQRRRNRLFVSWTLREAQSTREESSSSTVSICPSAPPECKAVGPETLCVCGHRYKQHNSDFKELKHPTSANKIRCQIRGCRCLSYRMLPILSGSNGVRCRCRHSVEDHRLLTQRSRKFPCERCDCVAYTPAGTCPCCRQPNERHRTLVETREERRLRGLPYENAGGPETECYKGLGALTHFASLST